MIYWYTTPDHASAIADLEPLGLAAAGELAAPAGTRRGEQTTVRYLTSVWGPAPTYDEDGNELTAGTDHGPHVWIHTTDPAVITALDAAEFEHLAESAAACPLNVATAGRPVALDDLKRRRQLEVNARRDHKLYQPLAHNNSNWDADPTSQRRIMGAAILAQIAAANGQPYSIDWIDADNQAHTLDGNQVIALGQAMAARESAIVQAARAHKDAVDALATETEVRDYDISGGWGQ